MSFADSGSEVGVLHLMGTWLQDPDNPEGTIRNYLYGANARTRDVDVMGVVNYYAGRMSPVVDYGEHEADQVACSVQIPHGPTWATDVAALRSFASGKRAVQYRDNRSRTVCGTMSSYRETDQGWGTGVSFTVTTTDAPVAETVVIT